MTSMADSMESGNVAAKEKSLRAHKGGKIELIGKVVINSAEDLSTYYTPGVAYVSLEVKRDSSLSYEYTSRGNTIAIVSDGSRVLGLGNIGPEAGIPVMEGKALLFKKYGGVDAIPLTINAHTTDEIVAFVKALEPSVGGINLEDISTPKNFEAFDRLKAELKIPVFHDDRQGLSVVALAALRNAMLVTGRKLNSAKIVVNGAGAAGIGITELLVAAGARDVVICDSNGIIYEGRDVGMNDRKVALSQQTNRKMLKGTLQDAVKGADALIGASIKGAFNKEMIKSMTKDPIVFALANPEPEISYKDAKDAGAAVVATGISGFPNQVNNLLAFPAIFRGVLDVRAKVINTEMLLAASASLAGSVGRAKLSKDHIVPDFCEENAIAVTAKVAASIAKSAIKTGVASADVDMKELSKSIRKRLKRYARIEKLVSKLAST